MNRRADRLTAIVLGAPIGIASCAKLPAPPPGGENAKRPHFEGVPSAKWAGAFEEIA